MVDLPLSGSRRKMGTNKIKGGLIVFVRAPRLGEVKSRLALETSEQQALTIYLHLIEALFDQLQNFENVELRFTPDDAASDFKPMLRNQWTLHAQGSGDLGDRLARAAQDAFEAGRGPVVIIGSDCPEVTQEDIEKSWDLLQHHDVVLGPAADGGYWLIGLRRPDGRLFDDIPWGTGAVFYMTGQRIREAGMTTQFLRTLSDIDTLADWEGYLARKTAGPAS